MERVDAVVVGGRVAGAATALQLARAGHRVLVLDGGRLGSDTTSTLALMRVGVLELDRLGVLPAIEGAGTPPVWRTVFHYGARKVEIDLRAPLYAPRRTVLDPILAAAAQEAGAEFRFGTRVRSLRRGAGGEVAGVVARTPTGERLDVAARVTVGADGRNSLVARTVGADVTRAGAGSGGVVYGYWSGVEAEGYEWCYARDRTGGLIPTNDGEVCVWAGVSSRAFGSLPGDRDAALRSLLAGAWPGVAARVEAGTRVGPVRGYPGLGGWMRRPWGSGWALVGDAGYFKDPLTAHGLTDALRDAGFLAAALDRVLREPAAADVALAAYEHQRDTLSRTLFDATDAIASYDWDLAEVEQHHLVLSEAMKNETRALRREHGDVPVA